jgi:hypothetical protein
VAAKDRAPHPLADPARRLQPALRGRRVLLVGNVAEKAALKTLVRLAGARVMAASDAGIAISLFVKFPIDVVVAEPHCRIASGESFEIAVRRVAGPNVVFVELDERAPGGINVAPLLSLAHSRQRLRRPMTREAAPRPRRSVRRTG